MSEPTLTRAPWWLAFRPGADGFVYAYLTDNDEMSDAIEVARFRSSFLNIGDVWQQITEAMGQAVGLMLTEAYGLSPQNAVLEFEKPKGGAA